MQSEWEIEQTNKLVFTNRDVGQSLIFLSVTELVKDDDDVIDKFIKEVDKTSSFQVESMFGEPVIVFKKSAVLDKAVEEFKILKQKAR